MSDINHIDRRLAPPFEVIHTSGSLKSYPDTGMLNLDRYIDPFSWLKSRNHMCYIGESRLLGRACCAGHCRFNVALHDVDEYIIAVSPWVSNAT